MLMHTSGGSLLGVAAMASRCAQRVRCCAGSAAGQDLGERFRLYSAPPSGVGVPVDAPVPLGGAGGDVCKPRGEVHRDGDWHRSVHIWLADRGELHAGGRLLLQQRSVLKDTHPGMLDVSCAGHVTGADGVIETAVREMEEELGLRFSADDLEAAHVCTLPCEASGATEAHGAFICREYQEIFLLRLDALPDVASLALGSDEGASVTSQTAESVLQAWEDRRDELQLVPRSRAYAGVLRAALTSGSYGYLGIG